MVHANSLVVDGLISAREDWFVAEYKHTSELCMCIHATLEEKPISGKCKLRSHFVREQVLELLTRTKL